MNQAFLDRNERITEKRESFTAMDRGGGGENLGNIEFEIFLSFC